MTPLEAVETAFAVANARLGKQPSFQIYQSVQAQLAYLLAVIKGSEADRSRLKEINFGVYAVKEFEDSDPDFAQVLYPAFWVATQMKKGATITNVPASFTSI